MRECVYPPCPWPALVELPAAGPILLPGVDELCATALVLETGTNKSPGGLFVGFLALVVVLLDPVPDADGEDEEGESGETKDEEEVDRGARLGLHAR